METPYDQVAERYDDGYKGVRWEVYDHVTRATLAAVMPSAPAKVLDAGAGTGKWALEFLAQGHEVTLLEPSAAMLEKARDKVQRLAPHAKARFVEGGIESMPFEEGEFDLVFCEGDPLSYCLERREEAARELVRVTRPGGGLYVSCDSRWWGSMVFLFQGDVAGFDRARRSGRISDPYGAPVHAFTGPELKALFERVGATDVQVCGKVGFSNYFPDAQLAHLLADAERRRMLLEAEVAFSQDPSVAGLGGHLQVVARRRS